MPIQTGQGYLQRPTAHRPCADVGQPCQAIRWERGCPHYPALTLALALPPLSPTHHTIPEKGSSATAVTPSPAKLATYTAPPLDSCHPQLRRVALHRTELLATPFEHR